MPAPTAETAIDRVDETDTPIGEVKRGNVFAERAGFRVVHVFVFNSVGKLLLQQLSENRERNPGKWGSSVAAYLRSGEDYLQAAERRLLEELGLLAKAAKFGSVVMPDQGARKFITLYLAHAEKHNVRRAEPDHLQRLSFWSIADVLAALKDGPDSFTETFRFLFEFFRRTLLLTDAGEWRAIGLQVPERWELLAPGSLQF